MIVGVCLVRNEEEFIERVLVSADLLVDRMVVLDNRSTDRTAEIVDGLGVERRIVDINETHAFVASLVEENHWIFGVDGDELYDPIGLMEMRDRIRAGEYDDCWRIRGRFIHATKIDGTRVTGYLNDHNPAKLYNGANLEWPTDHHSLFHAKTRKTTGNVSVAEMGDWDDSKLRCVHVRFLRKEPNRLTPEDKLSFGSSDDRQGGSTHNYRDRYREGELTTVEATWLRS